MIDVEQELREAFACRTATRHIPDLADRVITRARTVRRRRASAIATAGLAVVLLVAATLIRFPHGDEELGVVDLAGLPSGSPVRLPVFGSHSLQLPDGTQTLINSDPWAIVTQVHSAAGAWLVHTYNNTRAQAAVTMVRADSSTTSLGVGVVSSAISEQGDRVAVQSRVGDGQRVDVIDVPSGQPVAATPLAGEVYNSPVIARWAGSLVVLSASNGDAGPVASDVWDPAKGDYRDSMSGARLILGPAAEPGQLLALEPDTNFPDACLTWVDPSRAFTTRARKCDTSLRFGDQPPWVSPDGLHLIKVGGTVDVLDVRTMTAKRLGLPENARPVAVGWEDPTTALFRFDGAVMVRCRLDTSPCERAPTPQVDGGAPLGFVG